MGKKKAWLIWRLPRDHFWLRLLTLKRHVRHWVSDQRMSPAIWSGIVATSLSERKRARLRNRRCLSFCLCVCRRRHMSWNYCTSEQSVMAWLHIFNLSQIFVCCAVYLTIYQPLLSSFVLDTGFSHALLSTLTRILKFSSQENRSK